MGTKSKVIEAVVLIALAVVSQIIVGVLGQVQYTAQAALAAPQNALVVNSIQAPNIVGANDLTIALSGTYNWVSPQFPLTVYITGNAVSAYATNTAFATNSPSTTVSYVLNNPSGTYDEGTAAGNWYQITSISTSQVPAVGYPSVTATATQTFLAAVHNSAPWSNTVNTITASDAVVLTSTTGLTYSNTAGQSVTTVLNFLTIIFLVAALVILLSLFGLDKILRVGGGRNE